MFLVGVFCELGEDELTLSVENYSTISCPDHGGLRIASELIRPKVVGFLDQMLRGRGGSLRVEELTIPSTSSAVGKTLAELHVDETAGAVLLAVRPAAGGEAIFKPALDTPIEAGLTLIVMADHDGRERLRGSFENG